MAKVLQPFNVTLTYEDSNGDTGNVSLYCPAGTAPADIDANIGAVQTVVDALSLGQCIRYGYASRYEEDAYTMPTAAMGQAEDKGVFTFRTDHNKNVSVSIPSFEQAKCFDGTEVGFADAGTIIDLQDPDVAAWVTGCQTGFGPLVPSARSTAYGDIIAVHSAYFVQYGSKKRSSTRG